MSFNADPQGVNLVPKIAKSGRIYKVEFTGHTVGEHCIDLRYGGVPVPGSPFTCNLYDTKHIRISDVSTSANVSQPATFTGKELCSFILHNQQGANGPPMIP